MADPTSEVTEGTTLADYVDATGAADQAFVDECEADATARVDKHIGKVMGVPPVTRRLAILGVGSNLYNKRMNQTGMPTFDQEGGFQPAPRVAKDPMTPAYPILRPWVGPGFA